MSEAKNFLPTKKWVYLFPQIAAALSIFAALPTILRLNLPDQNLSFLKPWIAMVFNTGIALFVLGISLFLTSKGRKLAAQLLSLLILSLGVSTLVQDFLDLNFGIDQLIVAGNPTHFHPGRMAVSTAISFSLSGLMIFLLNRKITGLRLQIIGFLAGLISSITLLSTLVRFLPENASFNPSSVLHTALPTAIALLSLGLSILIQVIHELGIDGSQYYRRIPTLLMISLVFIACLAWQLSVRQGHMYYQALVADRFETMAHSVEENFKNTSTALARFATRIEYLGVKDKNFLDIDSHSYVQHLTSIRRIGITDSNLNVIWSYPPEIQYQVQGFNQGKDPTRRAVFEAAISRRGPVFSRHIELRSGGTGFLLPVPVFKEDKLKYIVYATLEAGRLFAPFIAANDFRAKIFDDAILVASSKLPEVPLASELSLRGALGTGMSNISIELIPTKESIIHELSWAPYAILIGGLFLAVLVSILGQLATLALQEFEWRKALFNAAEYAIISTNAQGIIQTFNKAAENLFQYTSEELVGQHTTAILHDPEDIAARAQILSEELHHDVEVGFETFIAKAKKHQHADQTEWTYKRKDGTKFPASLSVAPLIDFSRNIYGYLGIIIDVTERHRATQELHDKKDKLQLVVASTGANIVEHDYLSATVSLLNGGSSTLIDTQGNQSLNVNQLRAMIHPEDFQEISNAIEEHIAKKTTGFDIKYRLNQYGVERWLRMQGRVLTENGEKRKLLAAVTDVTTEVESRRALEKALVAAEEATKAKSIFLASMSHEIRTPLNGVIGMTDLLLDTDLKPDQKTYASVVQQSGTALLALINDILDFSKIESGKMELEETPYDITTLVEGQADILMAKAKEKGISLVTFVDPTLPPQVTGDAGRLGQVLLNFVGNAIKFTMKGGVTVYALPKRSDVLRFEIHDTGIGISETNLIKLFQPFVQADASIAGKFGGTGLGLSISKRLIEMMGGSVGATSILGAGSIFWAEVPMNSRKRLRLIVDEDSPLLNMRTLIVDDDFLLTQVLERYLKAWGMIPTIKTRQSAWEIDTPYNMYDLIILAGPDAEAASTYREIIHAAGDRAPKGMYLASFAANIQEKLLYDAGISGIIRKPVKHKTLRNALEASITGTFRRPDEAIQGAIIDQQDLTEKIRVLIADDNQVNQMVARSILNSLGYSATVVASGREALTLIEQMNFDIIFMDCQMPDIDGYEATAKIRASNHDGIRSIPIIALTANNGEEEVKRCRDAGMNDFLTKPFKKEHMKAIIDKWLPSLEHQRII